MTEQRYRLTHDWHADASTGYALVDTDYGTWQELQAEYELTDARLWEALDSTYEDAYDTTWSLWPVDADDQPVDWAEYEEVLAQVSPLAGLH